MSRPWIRFQAALEVKGISFEDVALASDRVGVIRGAGIEDPLITAMLETEWATRLQTLSGGGGGGRLAGGGKEFHPFSSGMAGGGGGVSSSSFSSSVHSNVFPSLDGQPNYPFSAPSSSSRGVVVGGKHPYPAGTAAATLQGSYSLSGQTMAVGGGGGLSPSGKLLFTSGGGRSGESSPGGGRTPSNPHHLPLHPSASSTTSSSTGTSASFSLRSSPGGHNSGGGTGGGLSTSPAPTSSSIGGGSSGGVQSFPPSPSRTIPALASVPGMMMMNSNNNSAAGVPRTASSSIADLLPSPHILSSLPEELQDVVLAREVLQAAIGIGGMFFLFIYPDGGGGGGVGDSPSTTSATARVDPMAGISTSSSSSPFSSKTATNPNNNSNKDTNNGHSANTSGGGVFASSPVRSPQFTLSSSIPASLRSLCEMVLPITDAYVALRRVLHAEYLGRSLVGMAVGEVVSEICTTYALEVAKLEQWSRTDPAGRRMPLMRVVSELQRLGYPIVRLRQVLPMELLQFSDGNEMNSATHPLRTCSSSSSSGGSPGAGATYLCGPRLLNHLGDQLHRCGGSREDCHVLQLLLHRAMTPYLRMLRRWMHEGVVEDPFGEFFIVDNAAMMMTPSTSSSAFPSSLHSHLPYYYASANSASSASHTTAGAGGGAFLLSNGLLGPSTHMGRVGGGETASFSSSSATPLLPSSSTMMMTMMRSIPCNKYISEVFPDVSGTMGIGEGGGGMSATPTTGGGGAVPLFTTTQMPVWRSRYGATTTTGGGMLSSHEAEAFERRFHMNTLLMPSFLETPNRRRRIAKMIFFTGKYCCILRECQEPLPDFTKVLHSGGGGGGIAISRREGDGGGGDFHRGRFTTSTTHSAGWTATQTIRRTGGEDEDGGAGGGGEERRDDRGYSKNGVEMVLRQGRGGGGGRSSSSSSSSSLFLWENMEDLHRMIQRSFDMASRTVIRLLFSPKVDLLGHLENIKIFYLHSRGDWITDFLDTAEELLAQPRDKVKVHSLRVLLQASIARSCHASHYPYHDRVGCGFSDYTLEQHVMRCRGEDLYPSSSSASDAMMKKNSSSTCKRGASGAPGGGLDEDEEEDERRRGGRGGDHCRSTSRRDSNDGGNTKAGDPTTARTTHASSPSSSPPRRCLEMLELDVDLKWPLTLVIDHKTMKRFNSVFRLLTLVKVCERQLCTLWSHNEVLSSFPAAYGIKHQMIHFLRQFQFFAAHFVLEPLWSRLVEELAHSAENMFSISQSLQTFFVDVECRLTLSSPTRFKSLRGLLELVGRFCEVGRHGSAATMPLIEGTLVTVQDQFLTGLSELAAAVGPDYPQLVPLLTFIDFSGFYDQHNVYHVQNTI